MTEPHNPLDELIADATQHALVVGNNTGSPRGMINSGNIGIEHNPWAHASVMRPLGRLVLSNDNEDEEQQYTSVIVSLYTDESVFIATRTWEFIPTGESQIYNAVEHWIDTHDWLLVDSANAQRQSVRAERVGTFALRFA